MKIEEFIECTKDELLAAKRNSFSRNIVKQNMDIECHEELMRLRNGEDTTNHLAAYLFTCKNLTIHAIDEEQTPISFETFDRIYGNAVFLLQYLPKKRMYALTLFRNADNSNKFTDFFAYSYYSGSNAFKEDRNGAIFESLLDFGLIKCAMTMNKAYGIQDLLEIAWQKFNEKCLLKYRDGESQIETNYPAKAARFMLNIEHPELSILTLYADNNLCLLGKTKIIDSDIDKLSHSVAFLDFQYNMITKGNKNGSPRTS